MCSYKSKTHGQIQLISGFHLRSACAPCCQAELSEHEELWPDMSGSSSLNPLTLRMRMFPRAATITTVTAPDVADVSVSSGSPCFVLWFIAHIEDELHCVTCPTPQAAEATFRCLSVWTGSSAAGELELTCLSVWHWFQSALISWCSLSYRVLHFLPPRALCLIFNSLIPGFMPGSRGGLNSSELYAYACLPRANATLERFLDVFAVSGDCIEFIARAVWTCMRCRRWADTGWPEVNGELVFVLHRTGEGVQPDAVWARSWWRTGDGDGWTLGCALQPGSSRGRHHFLSQLWPRWPTQVRLSLPALRRHQTSHNGFTGVFRLVQVYDGSTGPGDASAWRAERQRLEDHQWAPGLRRRHLGLHHTADVWKPSALTRRRSGNRKGLWALLISPEFRIRFLFLRCRLHICFPPWSEVGWNPQSGAALFLYGSSELVGGSVRQLCRLERTDLRGQSKEIICLFWAPVEIWKVAGERAQSEVNPCFFLSCNAVQYSASL